MSATSLKQAATGQVTAKKKPDEMNVFEMMDTYKSQIKAALPAHMTPDRVIRIVTTELRKTPALMKCNAKSLFGAVVQCAQLGLEPGGALGHVYLLPFENRKNRTTDVQLIIGYRGMIDLARRSGEIKSISARAVYENDDFTYKYGIEEDIVHIPFDGENRGRLKAVYAVARLKDGGVQFVVLSLADINRAKAQSKSGQAGPWKDHFEAMALKTAVRQLFKWLPISIEVQRFANTEETAETTGATVDYSNVIDNQDYVVLENDTEETNVDQETGEISEPAPAQNNDGQLFEGTTAEVIEKRMNAAFVTKDIEVLDLAADDIRTLPEAEQARLNGVYKELKEKLTK